MEPSDTELTHQPAGGTVDGLNVYFDVSMLKVIDLMSLDGPLFKTVTGTIACGSSITTSAPAGTETENVSASAGACAASRKTPRSMKRKILMGSS